MNNLLSYCGLVDTRISASEKDLPVCYIFFCFQIVQGKGIYCKAIPYQQINGLVCHMQGHFVEKQNVSL